MSIILTPMTRNVTKAFRLATDDDRAYGRLWYDRARALAVELANFYAVGGAPNATDDDVAQAAAVIAVLSPRQSWPKNVELARLAYAQYHLSGLTKALYFVEGFPALKANAAKAFRILAGEDPDDVVSGPKVRAFWHTIVNPSDPRAVVVDRHALDVALGRVTDDRTRGMVLGRTGAYDAVATCYVRAAKIISRKTRQHWTPAQVQAVIWTYWRRERAKANHG